MEKITKEELNDLLGSKKLSEEELEKISGGNTASQKQCLDENCNSIEQWPLKKACIMRCLNQ